MVFSRSLTICGVSCHVETAAVDAAFAYDGIRGQYYSTAILARLAALPLPPGARRAGVTLQQLTAKIEGANRSFQAGMVRDNGIMRDVSAGQTLAGIPDIGMLLPAMGYSDQHTLKSFIEAESYNGPSIIIAYSHCIAHGYDLKHGLDQQKAAVQSGHWPLMRYNPALADEGKNPLQIDSREPSIPVEDYAYNETRYRMLLLSDETRAEKLMKEARGDAKRRWELYRQMAAMQYNVPEEGDGSKP